MIKNLVINSSQDVSGVLRILVIKLNEAFGHFIAKPPLFALWINVVNRSPLDNSLVITF